MNATLTFTPDGHGHGLYTEALPLDTIGPLHIERATLIEFDNETQLWRVFDRTGCDLFNSPSRQACLDWEHRHMEWNHELQQRDRAVAVGA